MVWITTCLHDGSWELLPGDHFVSCQPIECFAPPFIPMALIETTYSESVGMSAKCIGSSCWNS